MATNDERPVSSAGDPELSTTLNGRYRIVGPGVPNGVAVSYAAEDVAGGRSVTLEVLHSAAAENTEFVAAVREQAHRLAKLGSDHPALVHVYDAGTTDEGLPFVVVEPAAGRSLREVLDERGALEMHEALRLAVHLGEGLETLHANGIVHGELTPESVVVMKGEDGAEAVKLVGVEFSSARRTSGVVANLDDVRKPYLAPEQLDRGETTEASDIYGLGMVLLEMLTGQRPGGVAAQLPPPTGRIIAKALERAPARRYSSISLMVNEMWSAQSVPAQAHADSVGPSSKLGERSSMGRRHARSDVGMAAALVVGLLLVGVTAWVVRSEQLRGASPESPEPVTALAASPTPAAVTPTSLAPPASTTAAEPTSMPRSMPDAQTVPAPLMSSSADTGGVSSAVGTLQDAGAAPAKPAVGAVRGPRPIARQPERPARSDLPSADGGDGTAIIDWLLKGGQPRD